MSQNLEDVLNILQQSEGLTDEKKTQGLLALKHIKEELKAKNKELEIYKHGIKVEISLEKMRKKTMTMHSSKDVAETVAILFEELVSLGVKTIRCGIGIMKDNMQMEIWTSNMEAKDKAELIVGLFDMTKHPMFQQAYSSWQNMESHFSYNLKGDDLIAYYSAVNNMSGYTNKYNLETLPKQLFHNSFPFAEGTLFVFSLEELSTEMNLVCSRFGLVFGQTYRRFLDLKDVEKQKMIVEEKHKEILDSINYAERIQQSFIATKEILDENLNDYFVLFKPKDVVSGDFYWVSKLSNDNFALVTADSTGHGVPGAIMSLLNITSLEKAIETLTEPSEILNSTRKTIIERLKKDGSEDGGKDGMDASLTVYDFKNNKLIVASANNPVWIVRTSTSSATKEIIEIKPDKMPVGKHDRDNISFIQEEIELQKGDVIYTLTDGFPDQFGGEKGKKFMSKNLKELLAANSHSPMHEQKILLEKTFTDWVGNLEQVDDVTLIGVRV